MLLLKNACYYAPEHTENRGFDRGHILLDEAKGIITQILPPEADVERLQQEQGWQVYDAAGKYVMPGAIDTHVHVREPGWPEREDYLSGTAAALAGGVTTICQMPNVNPTPHDRASLALGRELAKNKGLCRVELYGAAGRDNRAQLAELAAAGICGFKCFVQFGPEAGGPQYITVGNMGELEELLAAVADTGLRCFFHCEDYELIGRLERGAHRAAAEGYGFHYQTRPDAAELNAVQQVLHAGRRAGAKVGIVHVSTVAAAEAVRQAKAAGQDVTCEVCFHHLFFDDSWLDKFGPYAKCNPPLRSRANVEGLWEYVLDGTVDYIGSDHAPHLAAAKAAGETEIWRAPSGIAHMELMLPLLLGAVNRGCLGLDRLGELLCVRGYQVMGLYPQRGRIAEGGLADLTVVDLGKEWRFDHRLMQTKARETCALFDGLAMQGAVEATILGGKIMYAAGRVDYSANIHANI